MRFRYRVKKGMRHGAGGIYGPGDTVELTEKEAAGFLDKLQLVEDAAAHVEWSTPDVDLLEDMSVKDVFDTPTWQALEAADITAFGQVEGMSDAELIAVPGIGKVRLKVIRRVIAEVQGGLTGRPVLADRKSTNG